MTFDWILFISAESDLKQAVHYFMINNKYLHDGVWNPCYNLVLLNATSTTSQEVSIRVYKISLHKTRKNKTREINNVKNMARKLLSHFQTNTTRQLFLESNHLTVHFVPFISGLPAHWRDESLWQRILWCVTCRTIAMLLLNYLRLWGYGSSFQHRLPWHPTVPLS